MKKKRGKKEGSKKSSIWLIVLIFVFLVAASAYYFTAPSDDYQRGNLVGDGVCGNIGSEEGRNECCAEAHAGDVVIQCVGGWKYIVNGNICAYVCEVECTEDVRICDDGSSVVRNSSKGCEFEACPNES